MKRNFVKPGFLLGWEEVWVAPAEEQQQQIVH